MFTCLFSFNGASGRLHLVGNLFFWILTLISACLFYLIFIENPLPYLALILGVSLMSFFSLWAVTVRRIHDMGKSGWWAFLFVLLVYAPLAIIKLYDMLNGNVISNDIRQNGSVLMTNEALFAAGALVISAVSALIIFLVLVFVPGKQYDNPYIVE